MRGMVKKQDVIVFFRVVHGTTGFSKGEATTKKNRRHELGADHGGGGLANDGGVVRRVQKKQFWRADTNPDGPVNHTRKKRLG